MSEIAITFNRLVIMSVDLLLILNSINTPWTLLFYEMLARQDVKRTKKA